MKIGAAQALRVALTIASTIVIARILSPRDYGIAAMSAPVTAFLLMFQNLGFDQAVVQSRSVDDARLNALFWINNLLCLAVAFSLLAVAPIVAWFYRTPEAGYLVAASGVSAILTAPGLLHNALLNRELRFGALGLVDAINSVTVFCLTLVAALILHSFWALWVGSVVGALANLIALWSFQRWRPDPRPHFRGAGEMIRFGTGITGFNLANFFARNLDNILIARRWGGEAVGLYDRTYKLMMFPLQNINSPISGVMLPILGRLQDEPERYRRAYLMAVRCIQLLAIPGVVVAIAANDRLPELLLGERWAGVTPIFFWLGVCALAQPAGNPTGWLFITSKRTHQFMMWGLFSTATSIAAFLIGLPYGPAGVAACYCVGEFLRMPLQFWWATRGTPVSAIDLWAMHLPTGILAPTMLILYRILEPHLPTLPLLIVMVATSYSLMIAIYLCLPIGRELLAKGWAMLTLSRGTAAAQNG